MRAMGAIAKRLAGLTVFGAVLAIGVAVAAASAIVIIYTNNFDTGGRAHQLSSIQNHHCDKGVKHGSLKVRVGHSPNVCNYKLPVEADSAKSNLDIQADFKLGKETKAKLRKSARFGFRMRANGLKKYYELRVFPKKRKYVLLRSPEGKHFPVKDKSQKIKPVGRFTTLQMRTFGHKVIVYIGGKKVVEVRDPDPSDLPGGQLQVFFGDRKHSKDPAIFQLENVRVSVKKS
jgi:hypothetical protein